MQYFFWYVDIYINSLLSSFLALRIWIEPKFGKETRPKKRLGPDEKFTITGIRNDGEPIEPNRDQDLLLSVGSSLGTLSRSASTNGISRRAKTLKCLLSQIDRKMIFGTR